MIPTKIEDFLTIPTHTLLTGLATDSRAGEVGAGFVIWPGDPNSALTLVAHVDTLTSGPIMLERRGNIVRNLNGILGADDRAGVYAMLSVFSRARIKPHLIFTDGEESMGIGAKELIRTYPKIPDPIKSTKILIELDRRGANEYVCYDEQDQKVNTYVESFGFMEHSGSYSDITDIAPAWDIASVNLSVGYYDQHTGKESLHVDELELTINRVLEMTERPIGAAYRPLGPKNFWSCSSNWRNLPLDDREIEFTQDSLYCPECYHLIDADIFAQFGQCSECGVNIEICEECGEVKEAGNECIYCAREESVACDVCRTGLHPDAKWCHVCGSYLSTGAL